MYAYFTEGHQLNGLFSNTCRDLGMASKRRPRSNAVLERLAAQEAEVLAHRSVQDAKDKEFAEFLKSIELESAKAAHSIENAKKSLKEDSSTERKVQSIKAERQRSIENMTSSLEMATRICRTFRTLELNSNARELEQFCVDCGCIHTSDVLNDE